MFEIYYPPYRELIKQIEESSIARLFLSKGVNEKFLSYFRDEDYPSARLYYSKKTGRLSYNDFVVHLSLDYLLMELFGWDSYELSKNIVERFNITDLKFTKKIFTPYSKEQIPTKILKKARLWEQRDIDYWTQFGIPISFLSDPRVNVEPISKYWVINSKGEWVFNADPLAYSYNYYVEEGRMLRKIYQPYNKVVKWQSNITKNVCQLWNFLPKQGAENLIVSSSLKDSGTIYCNTEIYSCSPNNEMGFFTDNVAHKLDTRFKNKFVLFDQDAGGHLGANRYEQKYGWKSIFIPERFGVKDPAEYRAKYGHYNFYKLIEYLINGN